MVKQTVLVDFDGVVFRNAKVSHMVQEKSVRYVASRKGVHYRDAKLMNKVGYTKLGHTARLVSDDADAVQDYNEYVFDRQLFRWMGDTIGYTDTTLLQRVSNARANNDLRLVLCTNAPKLYCQHVLFYMGLSWSDVFDSEIFFTSDTGLIKPLDAYYNHVEDTLDFSEYHFIDDSISNIMPCIHRPQWKGCVINNEKDLMVYLDRI
jgi:FMN phosphatase YigB (HAD superfamily)